MRQIILPIFITVFFTSCVSSKLTKSNTNEVYASSEDISIESIDTKNQEQIQVIVTDHSKKGINDSLENRNSNQIRYSNSNNLNTNYNCCHGSNYNGFNNNIYGYQYINGYNIGCGYNPYGYNNYAYMNYGFPYNTNYTYIGWHKLRSPNTTHQANNNIGIKRVRGSISNDNIGITNQTSKRPQGSLSANQQKPEPKNQVYNISTFNEKSTNIEAQKIIYSKPDNHITKEEGYLNNNYNQFSIEKSVDLNKQQPASNFPVNGQYTQPSNSNQPYTDFPTKQMPVYTSPKADQVPTFNNSNNNNNNSYQYNYNSNPASSNQNYQNNSQPTRIQNNTSPTINTPTPTHNQGGNNQGGTGTNRSMSRPR